MARGTAFSELLTRLRAETGRSTNVAVGVDDVDMLREILNATYQTLYMNHDWAHLKKRFARFTLNAGQQFYDFPTGLNSERVLHAVVWRDGIATPLARGITDDDYNAYDPESDERAEPAMKWDVVWTGTSDQLEFWPLPSTNEQEVQFTGIQAAPRLVADADKCLLDDDLVVLFAAAEVLGEKDGKSKLSKAQEHLRLLKARGKGGETDHRIGLGGYGLAEAPKVVIRVS